MDQQTQQAIVNTGNLGKRVEAYLLMGLAMLDEMDALYTAETTKYHAARQAGDDAAAEAALTMRTSIAQLGLAIRTNGQGTR